MVHFISKKRGYQPATKEKQDPEEVKSAVKQAILPLCLPILIIGGIRIGIVTPTEAGTVAIVYALILGIIYKELKMSDVVDGLKEICLSYYCYFILACCRYVYRRKCGNDRISSVISTGSTGIRYQ